MQGNEARDEASGNKSSRAETPSLPAGIASDGHGGFVIENLDSFCQAVSLNNSLNILNDEPEELMEIGDEEVIIEVAMDSAAVNNVAQKDLVPYMARHSGPSIPVSYRGSTTWHCFTTPKASTPRPSPFTDAPLRSGRRPSMPAIPRSPPA